MNVKPLAGEVGCLIEGLDLTNLTTYDQDKLTELWLEKGLIGIRGQAVGPDLQIQFSKIFGPLEEHPIKAIRSAEYPELMELNSEDGTSNPVQRWGDDWVIGRLPWHKDLIYTAAPNRGALLKAVVLPEQDGQTGFGDQALAYEALSDDIKNTIDGLRVIYRFDVNLFKMPFVNTEGYDPGPNAPQTPEDIGYPPFPECSYPLVLVHPETGAKSLNVGAMFMNRIEGWDSQESDALLSSLLTHASQDQFTYFHQWQTGDIILWDNWRFMHSAPGIKKGDKRLIHRTTIRGTVELGRVCTA
jgi:taurine dioxygenase